MLCCVSVVTLRLFRQALKLRLFRQDLKRCVSNSFIQSCGVHNHTSLRSCASLAPPKTHMDGWLSKGPGSTHAVCANLPSGRSHFGGSCATSHVMLLGSSKTCMHGHESRYNALHSSERTRRASGNVLEHYSDRKQRWSAQRHWRARYP